MKSALLVGGPGRARSGAGEGSDCGEEAISISFNQPVVIKENFCNGLKFIRQEDGQ